MIPIKEATVHFRLFDLTGCTCDCRRSTTVNESPKGDKHEPADYEKPNANFSENAQVRYNSNKNRWESVSRPLIKTDGDRKQNEITWGQFRETLLEKFPLLTKQEVDLECSRYANMQKPGTALKVNIYQKILQWAQENSMSRSQIEKNPETSHRRTSSEVLQNAVTSASESAREGTKPLAFPLTKPITTSSKTEQPHPVTVAIQNTVGSVGELLQKLQEHPEQATALQETVIAFLRVFTKDTPEGAGLRAAATKLYGSLATPIQTPQPTPRQTTEPSFITEPPA